MHHPSNGTRHHHHAASTGDYAILAGDGARGRCRQEAEELASSSDERQERRAGEDGPTTEIRLNVFREVACVGWRPHSPRYWEAPPQGSLPPDVGALLAGGLYMCVLKTTNKLFPLYHPAYVVIFLFMLLLFLVMSWGTPLLFETTDSGEQAFKYGTFYACVIGVYLFGCVPSWIITRPAVVRFHEDMEAAVRDLVPVFRRFGYDLEYHRQGPCSSGDSPAGALAASRSCLATWVSCCDRESYVRITPFSGELTTEDDARAHSLWDPKSRGFGFGSASSPPSVDTQAASLGETIKVTVYHEDTIFGRDCRDDDLKFYSVSSYDRVQHRIDAFTWGAVAVAMRPFADANRPVRICIAALALVLNQFRLSMTDASTSLYVSVPLHILVGWLVVALYYPSGLVTWCLPHVPGRHAMFDEMQAAVQRLSPLVEERSGYGLRFETEKDGCVGGTAACVYFEPRGGDGGTGVGHAMPARNAQFPSSIRPGDPLEGDPRRPLVNDIV